MKTNPGSGSPRDAHVAFSPDGESLASISDGGESNQRVLILWDVKTGDRKRAFRYPIRVERFSRVIGLEFSPDGRRIIGADPNNIYIHNRSDLDLVQVIPIHSRFDPGFGFMSMSADGQKLGFCPDAHIIDLPSGRQFSLGGGGGGRRAAFRPDGKELAVFHTEHFSHLREIDPVEPAVLVEREERYPPNVNLIRMLILSEDRYFIAAHSYIVGYKLHTTVRAWDLLSGRQTYSTIRAGKCKGLWLNRDGTRFAAADLGLIVDYRTGREFGAGLQDQEWRKDVLSAGPDPYTRPLKSDIPEKISLGWSRWPFGLAFPGGSQRLEVGYDRKDLIRVKDNVTHRETLNLSTLGREIGGVAVSPDGTMIAAACTDGTYWIWDARARSQSEEARFAARRREGEEDRARVLAQHLQTGSPQSGTAEGKQDRSQPGSPPDHEPRRVFFEAEELRIIKRTGGRAETQLMRDLGESWSGAKQLFWDCDTKGSDLSLRVPIESGGFYEISLGLTRSYDYGIARITFDGEPLADHMDLYSPSVVSFTASKLGRMTLNPGSHVLNVSIKARDPRSTGYKFGIDWIELRRLP